MRIWATRKKLIITIVIAAFLLILCLSAVWAFFIEPNRLIVRDVTIRVNNWPPGFEKMRIAVLADLHVGSHYIDAAKLKLILTKLEENKPDLILILGDFMADAHRYTVVLPETIAEQLKGIRAPLGVFAVLGNHDWMFDGVRVRRALEAANIRVLENEGAKIESNGAVIWLEGLADLWTSIPDVGGTLAKVTDGNPIMAMTHNPDLFPRIPSDVSLVLAGHTHGGQVNFPLLGRLQVPSEFGQRYAAGLIAENNHQLFVTTGIGTSIMPVRFRVTPEIVILTLTSAP